MHTFHSLSLSTFINETKIESFLSLLLLLLQLLRSKLNGEHWRRDEVEINDGNFALRVECFNYNLFDFLLCRRRRRCCRKWHFRDIDVAGEINWIQAFATKDEECHWLVRYALSVVQANLFKFSFWEIHVYSLCVEAREIEATPFVICICFCCSSDSEQNTK